MPTLETKDFNTLLTDQATAMQASYGSDLDLTTGSVLRALVEANATVALWLEALIVRVLQMSRASTSTGTDLDTWVGDFGLLRLQAVSASGDVTLTRTDATSDVVVNIGTVVQTDDASTQFTIVEDITNPYWGLSEETLTSRYVIPAGVLSADFLVECVVPGASGNGRANTIVRLGSSIGSINSVTNAQAFTNGLEAETDAQLRARFLDFIESLARGTPQSVKYAAESVQTGLRVYVAEKVDAAGLAKEGHFTLVVDDGSGTSPSTTLLSQVGLNVQSYTPISVTFDVIGPTFVPVNVAVRVNTNTDPINTSAVVVADIEAAIRAHIGSLTLGKTLYVSELAHVIFESSEQVTNVEVDGVQSLLLNSQPANITPAFDEVLVVGTISITDLG